MYLKNNLPQQERPMEQPKNCTALSKWFFNPDNAWVAAEILKTESQSFRTGMRVRAIQMGSSLPNNEKWGSNVHYNGRSAHSREFVSLCEIVWWRVCVCMCSCMCRSTYMVKSMCVWVFVYVQEHVYVFKGMCICVYLSEKHRGQLQVLFLRFYHLIWGYRVPYWPGVQWLG